MDLELSPLTSGSTPGVTLFWNNSFDAFPPSAFSVVTTLVGSSNVTHSSAGAAQAAPGSPSDYEFELGGLLFFTNYSFSIEAMYTVDGVETTSDEVTIRHTTEEGGELYLCVEGISSSWRLYLELKLAWFAVVLWRSSHIS